MVHHPINRRTLLQRSGHGLGTIALSQLLAADGLLGEETFGDPMVVKQPHFAPRAKNVIFIFMSGGPSHLDLFDSKPALNKHHGEAVPASFLETLVDPLIKGDARCFGSPRSFRPYGQSGM